MQSGDPHLHEQPVCGAFFGVIKCSAFHTGAWWWLGLVPDHMQAFILTITLNSIGDCSFYAQNCLCIGPGTPLQTDPLHDLWPYRLSVCPILDIILCRTQSDPEVLTVQA
jgi:hypothetical protein